MPENHATKLFAWDGMEFPIPVDWDLSGYTNRRRVHSLTIEDATHVRMEMEWTAAEGRREAGVVRDQHARLTDHLHRVALGIEAVTDISEYWVVFLYAMQNSGRLITAIHVGEKLPLFVFARLHAFNCSRREIIRDARTLINGFHYYQNEPTPWRLYDIAWRVPQRFHLTGTSLLAGRKMMAFESRFRRLHLWRLSLADRLLREKTPADVAAEFLNRFKGFPGVRFTASGPDTVRGRRNLLRYPFGHYEEIGRLCFRYIVRIKFLPSDNALVIALYNYRNASDMQWLEGLILDDQP